MMATVDIDLISKYNVKGPRYTSYPTALQFHDLEPDQYLRAVETSSRRDGPLSLYFHIPFCRHLCYYCACSKIVTRDTALAEQYLEYLKREIELQAPLFKGRKVTQLHWGGGTPTYLTDSQIGDLMDCIRQHFDLADDNTGEFGIEIDPRTVDPTRIHAIRAAGFNRLSFGIQDFEPAVQEAVHRKQSFESTRDVIEAGRAAGIISISVDLIYGLPFQTCETMAATLERIVSLSPDRISIYNYAHLPDRFPAQKRIDVVDLPDAGHKLRILKLCIETLTANGWRYIGMDHFAKPDDELSKAQDAGTLHRNFQGYSTWADCDMVAMGITGISQVGNLYAQNAKTLQEYYRSLDAGCLPIVKGVQMTADDELRRAVIMSLICRMELDIADIETRFAIDFVSLFKDEVLALEDMAADGLLTIDHERIAVTDKGRLLIRNICMVFDHYLPQAMPAQRYSTAI